jgi:hypothetical protein
MRKGGASAPKAKYFASTEKVKVNSSHLEALVLFYSSC